MTEKIILETTTKYPSRRLNKENFDTFTSQAAFSYGYVASVSWMAGTIIICVLTFSIRNWLYFAAGWNLTNDEFMTFWGVWGVASSTLAYFTAKHIMRIGLVNKYLEYIKSPTEVTERQIQDGTAVLGFSTGANASEVELVDQREMMVNGNAEMWDASERMMFDDDGSFTLLVEHVAWFREQYFRGDRYLRKITSGDLLGTQDIPDFPIRDEEYTTFARLARANGYIAREGNKKRFNDRWVSEVLQLPLPHSVENSQ